MDNIYNYQTHNYKKCQYRIKDIMIPKKNMKKGVINFKYVAIKWKIEDLEKKLKI